MSFVYNSICVPFHCGVPMTVTGCICARTLQYTSLAAVLYEHFMYQTLYLGTGGGGGGGSDSPIKTAKCSFLRTNMQCGFIKVIRMKRGSSNCKMIVAS